jgi:hypothetical protein
MGVSRVGYGRGLSVQKSANSTQLFIGELLGPQRPLEPIVGVLCPLWLVMLLKPELLL